MNPDLVLLSGVYHGTLQCSWYKSFPPVQAQGWLRFNLESTGDVIDLSAYVDMGDGAFYIMGGVATVYANSVIQGSRAEVLSLPGGSRGQDFSLLGGLLEGGWVAGVLGVDDGSKVDTDSVTCRFTAWKESCSDGDMNNTETDVDCGGVCAWAAGSKCAAGRGCSTGDDCVSGSCSNGVCL